MNKKHILNFSRSLKYYINWKRVTKKYYSDFNEKYYIKVTLHWIIKYWTDPDSWKVNSIYLDIDPIYFVN